MVLEPVYNVELLGHVRTWFYNISLGYTELLLFAQNNELHVMLTVNTLLLYIISEKFSICQYKLNVEWTSWQKYWYFKNFSTWPGRVVILLLLS